MNRKVFYMLIALFSINTAISQDSIRLQLEFKMVHVVDTTQPENPRIYPCMLLTGSKMSVFDDYYRTMRYLGYRGNAVDRVYNDSYDIQDAEAGITSDQIFTDFEKQEMITGSYFQKNLYAARVPITKIEWSIEPQTKQILKQECQMAKATFKGRHYTAWFAPAIPINAGPWKLNGLPGIILAASDDRNEISFICTRITMPEKNAPLIVFSKNATLVSAEKLAKTKKAFEKNPKAGMDMSDPRGTLMVISVSPGATSPMSQGTKTKHRPLNNPIEKE